MPLSRWELLLYAVAILLALLWTSREPLVNPDQYVKLDTKIKESTIPKTEEDETKRKELFKRVLAGSDEADGYYTELKTKFDPSPLGENGPNPNWRPYIQDLRKNILKKELKMQKDEMTAAQAMSLARNL